jgi:diguanylate cyclase (GGDEF)-like protein
LKSVNHAWGDHAGDVVLAESASRVMNQLRPYDETFRCGGDEFLVCTPGTTLEQGYEVAERLRHGIASAHFKVDGQDHVGITVSIGITILDPDAPVEDSIERAEQALTASKESGRNLTSVWKPSLN